jgi:hypothetical protein
MESLLSWPTDNIAQGVTRKDIVRWWESRRLRFNLYVGAIGLVTWFLVLVAGAAAVKPGEDFQEPIAMIFGPLIYAFMANICYTLGWIIDTIAFWGSPRTRIYKAGVIFSVILA